MSSRPKIVDTKRIRFLRPTLDDAQEIFERYAGDEEVTRLLGWPRHQSIEDARLFVTFSDSVWEKWPIGPLLMRSTSDQSLLGGAGFTFDSETVATTGYVLARDCWGQGLATECLEAHVLVAPSLGIKRLYALTHPEHRSSQRVLEKCEFANEGLIESHLVLPDLDATRKSDVVRYARAFE